MKNIGWTIKQVLDRRAGVSITDLITDLAAFADNIEEFAESCKKNPFIIAGKGKDAEPLDRLLAAIREFKYAINAEKQKKSHCIKPFLRRPAGPGKHGEFSGGEWCTAGSATGGPIDCQICGTTHPERDTPYSMSRVLGLQVVDECCGAVVDILFEELSEPFASRLLWQFASNPSDTKHHILLVTLQGALKAAKKKLAEVSGQVAEISKAAEAIK